MTRITSANMSFAQSGEDLILDEIYLLVGDESLGYYFEIGAGIKGRSLECNTFYFHNKGWKGTIIDMNCTHPLVTKATVSEDNILDLMKSCPKNINIFSIDIDSYDWYIVKKVLDSNLFDIDIFCTEINSYHEDKYLDLIQHRDYIRKDKSICFGATLVAYKRLFNKYGYVLVRVENRGVNAFWVKEDKAHLFQNVDDFEYHYKRTSPKSGWAKEDKTPKYLTSEELLKEDNNEQPLTN